MGVVFGPRSVNRQCGCRTGGRLSALRWENGSATACHHLARHRSCHRKPVFRRRPAHRYLRGAPLWWRAMSVGFGDRQPCPRRSRHSSDGAAHHCRGRGTVCWRTATRIDLQYRNFAIDTGSYPTDVVDGVSRSLDEAVPPQSARPDPAPAKPLFQSEGGLGIDRRHDLIGALTPAPVFQHRQCLSSEG
ncbi:hypothetical protein ABIB68_006601 [Bradyrhizobium sp. F1.2.2]